MVLDVAKDVDPVAVLVLIEPVAPVVLATAHNEPHNTWHGTLEITSEFVGGLICNGCGGPKADLL